MQVLISLPGMEEIEALGGMEPALFRKVCGIPLLARVIATASRSGGREVLLLYPKALPEDRLKACLNSSPLSSIPVHTLARDSAFDPDNPSDWQAIESRLESKFLWLPWNYVAEKKALTRMIEAGKISNEGVRFGSLKGSRPPGRPEGIVPQQVSPEMPAVILKEKLKKIAAGSADGRAETGGTLRRYLAEASLEGVSLPRSPGILVDSRQTTRQAERELVRRSGKDTDGIFSKFNRWLSRPAVRWLSKTPVTPNMVSFAGLAITVLSAYWFAQGYWAAYVLGALLYFISVLFDEMDGMLARLTFRESALGCWLETFVDYTSYIVLFAGMTIGMYREEGAPSLAIGGVLLFGALTSFLVLSRQRKLATDPGRPQDYLGRIHRRLEADAGNILSRFARHMEFLIRRAAFSHLVLLLTVLGHVKAFFWGAAIASNVVWVLGLYFNRLFRRPPEMQPGASCPLCSSHVEEGR